jgi:hypothetical protein
MGGTIVGVAVGAADEGARQAVAIVNTSSSIDPTLYMIRSFKGIQR